MCIFPLLFICGKISGGSCVMVTESGVSKFETVVHAKHLDTYMNL